MTPEQIEQEREKFERWYLENKTWGTHAEEFFRRNLTDKTKYLYTSVQISWEAWFARASDTKISDTDRLNWLFTKGMSKLSKDVVFGTIVNDSNFRTEIDRIMREEQQQENQQAV